MKVRKMVAALAVAGAMTFAGVAPALADDAGLPRRPTDEWVCRHRDRAQAKIDRLQAKTAAKIAHLQAIQAERPEPSVRLTKAIEALQRIQARLDRGEARLAQLATNAGCPFPPPPVAPV